MGSFRSGNSSPREWSRSGLSEVFQPGPPYLMNLACIFPERGQMLLHSIAPICRSLAGYVDNFTANLRHSFSLEKHALQNLFRRFHPGTCFVAVRIARPLSLRGGGHQKLCPECNHEDRFTNHKGRYKGWTDLPKRRHFSDNESPLGISRISRYLLEL